MMMLIAAIGQLEIEKIQISHLELRCASSSTPVFLLLLLYDPFSHSFAFLWRLSTSSSTTYSSLTLFTLLRCLSSSSSLPTSTHLRRCGLQEIFRVDYHLVNLSGFLQFIHGVSRRVSDNFFFLNVNWVLRRIDNGSESNIGHCASLKSASACKYQGEMNSKRL